MVSVLELQAVFEEDLLLRACAGFACLCCYGRLRCSDAGCITSIAVDAQYSEEGTIVGGFLEASALSTKTAVSKEKKRTFLPVVVPLIGLMEVDWWGAFVECRRMLGLAEIPETGSMKAAEPSSFTLLPCELLSARAGQSPVTSDELSCMMQRLLRRSGFSVLEIANVASHSLKATWLSVAAKAGVPLRDRQLL
eukprot:903360-Karenia_brevis.AAC.1